MPYYRWRGVDTAASYQKGRLFAGTIAELEQLLLRQGIALTRVQKERILFKPSIRQSQIIDFLKQLSVLLQSGILLPQALGIIAEQTAHVRMQELLVRLADLVERGVPLSEALEQDKAVFPLVTIHMIRVGEESGCLASSIDALVGYLETAEEFKKKVQSAAAMPCLTLAAFCIIAIGVVIGIVPRFTHLFRSMGKELPSITQKLLYVSNAVQSSMLWFSLGGIVGILFLLYRLFNTQLKPYVDCVFLHIPMLNALVINTTLLYWLHAVGMLLKNEIPLVPALRIAHPLVRHHQLKNALAGIADAVAAGNTLRFALLKSKKQPFSPEILALIQVGQESGRLSQMIEKSSMVCRNRVEHLLRFCTGIIQPLLLIIMGLLVAFLVFALYMPIFNMAHIG